MDIARPDSARALLLLTPDPAARAPETDGVNDPLVPGALATLDKDTLSAEAADWEPEVCGLLRASFIPEAG